MQLAPRRRAVLHGSHQHAGLARAHAEVGAQRVVLQRLRGDADAGHMRRQAAARAGEEASDDRRRHHLADVLGVGQGLEGDADDLAAREHRAAAVAFVDGGVDGDGEQVALAVLVPLHLDARDDALGDRHLFAADRVTDHLHGLAQPRQVADARRRHAGGEGRVLDLQQREVAVVADDRDAGDDLGDVVLLLHLHEGGVGDDVGAGEHLPRPDDHARAGAAARRLGGERAVAGDVGLSFQPSPLMSNTATS